MKRYPYLSRGEKIRDFVFGFLGLFVFGILLSAMFLTAASLKIVPIDLGATLVVCATCIPPLTSLIAVIYFGLTRHWIALGVVAGFLFAFACGMLGYALLIVSGFSLV